MKKLWSVVLALALVVAGQEAEAARRLGGGQSIGRQSSNVTQREATSPAPATTASPSVAPAGAGSSMAKPAPTPAPAAAQAPRRPWGAMLGGLAAGLGLAWLAHSLGFGEAFGQILMVALLAMVAMAVIGWFMRSRRGAAAALAPTRSRARARPPPLRPCVNTAPITSATTPRPGPGSAKASSAQRPPPVNLAGVP